MVVLASQIFTPFNHVLEAVTGDDGSNQAEESFDVRKAVDHQLDWPDEYAHEHVFYNEGYERKDLKYWQNPFNRCSQQRKDQGHHY